MTIWTIIIIRLLASLLFILAILLATGIGMNTENKNATKVGFILVTATAFVSLVLFWIT